MGFQFLKLQTMKKHTVFFLKQSFCIAVLHILNVRFATNEVVLPAACAAAKQQKAGIQEISTRQQSVPTLTDH